MRVMTVDAFNGRRALLAIINQVMGIQRKDILDIGASSSTIMALIAESLLLNHVVSVHCTVIGTEQRSQIRSVPVVMAVEASVARPVRCIIPGDHIHRRRC